MTVLLTGGAGYIGSHVTVELLQSGYDVIIADNFYNSSQEVPERIRKITEKSVRTYNVDIQNSAALEQIFKQHEINAVMHFAGYKAVGEAVQQPLKYYRGNLDSTLTLLETMGKYQVKNLIFSSSATVYGNPSTLPITEACPTGNIASPYGWTKYMIEQIITDYAAATLDFSAVIFRYFNPVGAHPSGLIGEAPNGTPNNLMPYITQVAMGKRKQLSVFGADYDTPDGTCIRDYIHIMDIAAGHTAALPFCTSHHGVEVINLGTGMGHSVLELISAFESATGVHIPFQIVGRRAGDIPVCFASAEKAKALPSEEEYAEARKNLAKVDWAVDYVITHCAPTSIALMENRHNEADPLTDFLQEVKERAHYHYWLFGHYHDNRAIDEKHILLWEQIVQVI